MKDNARLQEGYSVSKICDCVDIFLALAFACPWLRNVKEKVVYRLSESRKKHHVGK